MRPGQRVPRRKPTSASTIPRMSETWYARNGSTDRMPNWCPMTATDPEQHLRLERDGAVAVVTLVAEVVLALVVEH